MPRFMNRRVALGAIASISALGVASVTSAHAAGDDAEIVALAAEIVRLVDTADHVQQTRVDPFEDAFQAAFFSERDPKVGLAKAAAYSLEVGREAAIQEACDLDSRADALFDRMMAIPATGQPGRAAKVRSLLVHVCRGKWRGPAAELNWHRQQTRALLGEFAGLSAAELESI